MTGGQSQTILPAPGTWSLKGEALHDTAHFYKIDAKKVRADVVAAAKAKSKAKAPAKKKAGKKSP